MDSALKTAHGYAHSSYIRGTIGQSHFSFHDPFVFLLHSNVDRLWAQWQVAPGHPERLDPNQVYGNQGTAPSILANLEPWSGGTPLRPWAPPENQGVPHTPKAAYIVTPPLYDTMSVFCTSRFTRLSAA
jgi:Common central domain of tyrosinase